MANTIKKITVGSTQYDLSALYLLDSQGGEHTYESILNLIEAGFDIVVLNSLPTADADAYATYHNSLVLVPNSGTGSNTKDEYVIQRSGTEGSYTYAWELIGTTEVDLSDYVHKGTYTTDAAGSGDTGSAGAETIPTSSDGAQTATGTATIAYDKATAIVADGAIDTNTGNAGGATINGSNFTFTGSAASLSATVNITPEGSVSVDEVPAHSHTINISAISTNEKATVVTGVTEASLTGDTTFAVEGIKSVSLKDGTGYGNEFNTDAIKSATLTGTTVFATEGIASASIDSKTVTADGYKAYVESVANSSLSGNTGLVTGVELTGTQQVVTNVTTTTDTVMQNATVTDGVLSFGSTVVLASATGSTTNIANSVTTTTGDVTLNNGAITTKYIGVTTTAATTSSVGISTSAASKASVGITTTAASLGTVGITGGVASGTTDVLKSLPTMTISQIASVTLSATFVGTAGSAGIEISYTPEGTIGGSQTIAAHSHTVQVASHTHGITSTSTTVTGTAAVAVTSHTHSVTTSSHTHSIGSHTHDISLQTPNASN